MGFTPLFLGWAEVTFEKWFRRRNVLTAGDYIAIFRFGYL